MVSFALAAALLSQQAPQLDIVYKEVEGRKLQLDFYPAATTGSRPAPLVVVFHGGAWITGKRQDVGSFCSELAKMGMSAATVEYRLAPASKWPAMIEDAESSILFLKKNAARFAVDPDRVGAAGFSAGAHLALLLGSLEAFDPSLPQGGQSSRVKAVLNVFGPTDLLSDFDPFLSGLIAQQLLGKKLDAAEKEMKAASPVNLITAKSAPVFTIHGTIDKVVPVNQASRLDEVMRKAKVEHVMRIVPDLAHEDPRIKPKALEALKEGMAWMLSRLTSLRPGAAGMRR